MNRTDPWTKAYTRTGAIKAYQQAALRPYDPYAHLTLDQLKATLIARDLEITTIKTKLAAIELDLFAAKRKKIEDILRQMEEGSLGLTDSRFRR